MYYFIIDNHIATEEEVDLVTQINGYSEDKLNDIIWCRTGYHDIEQIWDCERESYYFSDELKERFGLDDDDDDDVEE